MSDELVLMALRVYRQCDDNGVMCIVSRQAVDEAVAEIERLRAEVAATRDLVALAKEWQAYAEKIESQTDSVIAEEIQRLRREKPRLESALAALRKRVEEAPVVEWSREDWIDHCDSVSPSYIGMRVALVVLGEG